MAEEKEKPVSQGQSAPPGKDKVEQAKPHEQEVAQSAPPAQEAQTAQEPYGAQLLRELHDHHSQLMPMYHEWMAPLDHPKVRGLMQKHLQGMDKNMSAIEQMMATEYPHLDAIEGAMKEGEEEGDDEKSVKGDKEKPKDKKAPPKKGEEKEKPKEKKDDKKAPSAKKGEKSLEGDQNNKALKAPNLQGNEPQSADGGNDAAYSGMDSSAGTPDQESNGDMGEPQGNGLDPAHAGVVQEVLGYLGSLANEMNFVDEHRMKAYHYHKLLDGVGNVGAKSRNTGESSSHNTGANANIAGEPSQDAPAANKALGDGMSGDNPLLNCIAQTSQFLRALSTTRDFGDPHRAQAVLHHNAILSLMPSPNPAPTSDAPAEEQQPLEAANDAVETNEPDEDVKTLHKMLEERRKMIADLTRLSSAFAMN